MAIDWRMGISPGPQLAQAFTSGQNSRLARDLAMAEAQQKQQSYQQQQSTRASALEAINRGDYASAAGILAASGQNESATALNNTSKLRYDQQSDTTEGWGNFTLGLNNLPYEQRKAVIQANRSRLLATGLMTPEEVDSYDPTDENNAAVSQWFYSLKDRVDDQNTAYANQTDRMKTEYDQRKPVVVGGSLVTQGGQELYRAPEYINAPTTNNVYEVGGTTSDGYSTTLNADQTFQRMLGTESNYQQFDANGQPLTSSAGAIGIAQVMPGTAPEAAKLAGLPWDESRYRNDPAYNRALGQAYFRAQVERYGGDLIKATAAYNAGPGNVDRAVARAQVSGGDWTQYLPAETQDYITKVHGQKPTTRQVRTVQQGQPKADSKSNPQDSQLVLDSYDRAIASIERLKKHPGLSAAVGSGLDPAAILGGGYNPVTGKPFGGTDAAGFMGQLDALKAQVFLPMVQSLRGMGALSENEGKKLTDAIGALDVNMPETEFRASLDRVLTDLQSYRDRSAQGASGSSGSSSAQIVTVTTPEQVRSLPSGTRFRTPDGRIGVKH